MLTIILIKFINRKYLKNQLEKSQQQEQQQQKKAKHPNYYISNFQDYQLQEQNQQLYFQFHHKEDDERRLKDQGIKYSNYNCYYYYSCCCYCCYYFLYLGFIDFKVLVFFYFWVWFFSFLKIVYYYLGSYNLLFLKFFGPKSTIIIIAFIIANVNDYFIHHLNFNFSYCSYQY